MKVLLSQALPVEFVFEVSSEEDVQLSEQLIEQHQIDKYRLKPNYTGNNIRFFENEVFLSKEDILSTPMTMKDFFARQAMNLYDFGKITILPNGDVYANLTTLRWEISMSIIFMKSYTKKLKRANRGSVFVITPPARIVFINGFARLHPIMR